jgi:hypothetical protein
VEDIVALRVALRQGGRRYFLTWGRLFDAVDGKELEQVVAKNLHIFSLGGAPTTVQLCDSIQEASREPYFFEALWHLAQEKVPYGSGHKRWVNAKRKQLLQGKELYYLGIPTRSRRRRPGAGVKANS